MTAPPPRPAPSDVLIVGAGPAGIGMAATLGMLDLPRVHVVDRHDVGASFRRWPSGTRLLTPSFPSNGFGAPDLNAITPDTSPGLMAGEHPTGRQYADYLQAVVRLRGISVETGVDVLDVERGPDRLLRVRTRTGDRLAKAVVWAAGERAHPNAHPFPGAELAVHTSRIRRYADMPGPRSVVIGGYESGIEAALALQRRGIAVTVLDRSGAWAVRHPDPSRALSPLTRARLDRARRRPGLELVGGVTVTAIGADLPAHVVHAEDGRRWRSDGPPVLATGYTSSLDVVRERFEFDDCGRVVVTEEGDESTVLPGLHLSGPMLRHGDLIFCFIYKFRQRFGVVAESIAERLGVDARPLRALADAGMLSDDLKYCGSSCAC